MLTFIHLSLQQEKRSLSVYVSNVTMDMGLDQSGYQLYIFLISPGKHVAGTYLKCLAEALQMSTTTFFWRNKKNINTSGLKKEHLIETYAWSPEYAHLSSLIRAFIVCLMNSRGLD